MKKIIIVQLDDQKVEVKKLPIGEYADLLKAVKKLPSHFKDVTNLNTEIIIQKLPEIAGDSLPDLLGVISIATKMPVEEVAKLGLDEIAKLIVAIYQVNNYAEVYALIKKGLAHPSLKKITQKNQETS